MVRRALRFVATSAVCAIVLPIGVVATLLAALLFLPLPTELPEPRPPEGGRITRVHAANGEEIGQFREFEQNVPVAREDIPLHLKQAVISAEDRSFYSHTGIDIRGSIRALWSDLQGGQIVQGGSTITQQYVKNTYVGKERTLSRKLREAVLARQIDRTVEKDEILFRYLSTIYLGAGAYGVGAASETYFRKPVSQLTLSEAALMAGVIPAPSRYEPRENPAAAETKRSFVLDRMLDLGYIDPDLHAAARAEQVWLASRGPAPGPATVVHPPEATFSRYPYFLDYVRRYLVERYGPEPVFRGGLRVETTLDPALQAHADEAVAASLRGTSAPLEMSLVTVEPPTGFVKALVGGRDFYDGDYSQVNLALGGCPARPTDPVVKVEVAPTCWDDDPATIAVEGGGTGRQPGSAFKPFVLSAAYSEGMPPTKVYPAPAVFRIPGCKGDKCTIGNAEGGGGGSANLRTATVRSINTVYAQLVRDVGCRDTAEMTKRLGITSAWYSPQFHSCSGTYALGVIDVSPLDMASAFGVFAARGLRYPATPVVRVTDAAGAVLEDNTRREPARVLDEVVADLVNDALQGVITGGTATRAAIDRPAAGKTGTGQNYTNAWFVGYTPNLSTAVWMGYAGSQSEPLRNIRGVSRVFGGTIPAATWKAFMGPAHEGLPVTGFDKPTGSVRQITDQFNQRARTGIDPGTRRNPVATPAGGALVVAPPPPSAEFPLESITTSTTTTVRR